MVDENGLCPNNNEIGNNEMSTNESLPLTMLDIYACNQRPRFFDSSFKEDGIFFL